jgi:membrane fusion protein, copper/silver efflux system
MTNYRCARLLVAALLILGCKDASRDHAAHAQALPNAPGALHAGHAASAAAGTAAPGPLAVPAGYADFNLESANGSAIALQTAKVTEQKFDRTLRTTGVVTLDETRTSHVHTKVRGWIETISADFVGKKVTAGSPLCSIYSQEVYAAELEYLSILEQVGSRPVASGKFAEADQKAGDQLLAAARRRLALWDVSETEIARLERSREARRTFSLVAPRSGIIVAKQALAGMLVEPSTELYVISETSRLWLLSDIYEKDVPFVEVGARATLRIEGLGAEEIHTKVVFIPPTIDEATRTLRVRLEVPNEDGRIRPGAFATVEMTLGLGRALGVPETAVIHAGTRDIVFVIHGSHVQPRSVVLGPLVGDQYPVREGLAGGESVAVGAQFLIDSESRLRATSQPGGAHAGH